MIQLTHIYKTEHAGNRENQSTLSIDANDPKFFFTLQAEKPCTFTVELLITGQKPQYHIFDIHEKQLNRGIDYAFPLAKLSRGEFAAVFIIYVKGVITIQKPIKIIIR